MNIIGIDPGWSGGIALIKNGNGAEARAFTKMTERDIIDILTLYFLCSHPVTCYIEKVHSMPAQGVASSFKFGHIYGLLRGMILDYKLPMVDITPQKWQKALGCLSKGDKNVTKAKAQQLFPKLKVTHGIADALLIAEYGRREQIQIGGFQFT